MPATSLVFAGVTHASVKRHLLPGDGKESAAILVCSRSPGPRLRLLVRHAILVPHDECSVREVDRISWPGKYIEDAIDLAEPEQMTIILLHSHPRGWLAFSHVDDASDVAVLPSLFEAFGDQHGSAVMTQEGMVRARLYSRDLSHEPIDLVMVAGDDISLWWDDGIVDGIPSRRPEAFTSGMTSDLGRLSAGLIGVSGTGSIVGEEVTRLGFGKVRAVDHDIAEFKNLNRILNSTLEDAAQKRTKVQMFADSVARHRGPGAVETYPLSIASREAVEAIGGCDVLFCCVDTQEARQFADLISAAFLIPLFDVGVVIPTRKDGENIRIADACGRVDYVQPGGSTLFDRKVYSPEGLRAEYLRQVDPEAFERERAAGYIKGMLEEAPSVITLNMRAASAAVSEFIARAYPFRHEPNRLYARTSFSLAACEEDYDREDDFPAEPNEILARGDAEPLLGLPLLSVPRRASE